MKNICCICERKTDMIDRDGITKALTATLEPLPYIHALWLEGADANGMVDEYSDIDFWIDFDDEQENNAIAAVEEALARIGEIDLMEVLSHPHPKIRQRIYHLAGTSEFLMLDVCWQCHSRGDEIVFITGSNVENAQVLFDKSNVVRWKDYDPEDDADTHEEVITSCQYRYGQHSRVLKYIRRGLYLETYAYYNQYILNPLIDLLRVLYTPANTDYTLCHISHHIPADARVKLEWFAQIASLDDIEMRLEPARAWFNELVGATVGRPTQRKE